MNLLDVLIGAIVVVSVITGFRRGAALQVVTYTGLIIGLIVGALIAPRLAALADDPFAQATIALLALLLFAAVGDAIGWLIGRKVWIVARQSRLGRVDAGAGSVVAGAAALITVWFLAFNLVQGPFPVVSRQIRGSVIVRGLDAVLPRPPSLLAQVRTFFDQFGFPEVFAGLPPAPAGPVKEPTQAEASRAFDAADQSTVRILGQACDRIQEGSGFVVEGNHVVTNAHVVAGGDSVSIEDSNGTHSGVVVVFDPRTDVAVVRAPGLAGPPLPLETSQQDDGTPGATLGFPGSAGGVMRVHPAAVQDSYPASGRDIYGRAIVERDVYEVRSQVRQGDSGGPFVLPNGRVAGVVFAASTVDGDIGYALTGAEVADEVREGSRRTEPVGTGPCTR